VKESKRAVIRKGFSKKTAERDLQPLNHRVHGIATEEGIQSDPSERQPLNVPCSILFR
jgi:hypothetical protein